MITSRRIGLLCVVWSAAAGGCCYPVREHADALVCQMASQPLDTCPLPAPPPGQVAAVSGARKADLIAADSAYSQARTAEPEERGVEPASSQQPSGPSRGDGAGRPTEPLVERFQRVIPPELRPALNVRVPKRPPLTAPPEELEAYRRQMQAFIRQNFPALPRLGSDPQPVPGPDGRPLTLADLQRLALSTSPLIRQAAANLQAARGAAIQSGAYPNPSVGYQSDNANTGGTAGYQGFFIEQTIKTGGKLKLAAAASAMDVANAELALRKAQADLTGQVRGGYFAVLVALENLRVSRFLVNLTETIYDIHLRSLEQGFASYYDVQQVRVLTLQSHALWVQARNRYESAWHQLAAALGLPGMPPTQVEGDVKAPVLALSFEAAQERLLANHTDVLTARNTLQKNRYNLRLAQVTPVPDVSLHLAVEKDYTTPPFLLTHSIQLGVPLPVWDTNKGNIIQAQANLLGSVDEEHRVRDDLSQRLADAFERYENNRILLSYYTNYMLSDEVSAFLRAISGQGIDNPLDIRTGVTSVVTNQGLLVTVFTGYVTALAAQWTAVVDVATLLQANDLFEVLQQTSTGSPIDQGRLPPLPCCHPCSPVPRLEFKGVVGPWDPAVSDMPPAG